jgi:3-isopropylmalate/(R)-2-methylmalate dehydratase large subunit
MATTLSAQSGATAPMTATQKFLARASQRPYVEPGEVVYPVPELVIIHDGFVETAYRELHALGYGSVVDPHKVIFVTDHEVAYGSQRAVERGRNIRAVAKAWDIKQLYDAGRGGHGHIFPIEAGLIRPGMFLFCYDMHCTNFGAVGALAMAAGTEVTSVLATGTLWTSVPETLRIDLLGVLNSGAHARDVGFLLAQGFADGRWEVQYDNRVVEFGGPGLASLDLPARVALCNSITEMGVANVLFDSAPPGIDVHGAADFLSDPGARYEARISFDLSTVEPQVALPGGPDRAERLASVVGTRIDHASLGACGSGMYQDFADAARIMRGRRVAEGVRLFVVPGTAETARRMADEGLTQIFVEAGAIMLPPGCGPCAGGLMAPLGPGEVSVSTAATNHAGRFGAQDGEIYLASPLTVAASAVAGCLTDFRNPSSNS